MKIKKQNYDMAKTNKEKAPRKECAQSGAQEKKSLETTRSVPIDRESLDAQLAALAEQQYAQEIRRPPADLKFNPAAWRHRPLWQPEPFNAENESVTDLTAPQPDHDLQAQKNKK